MVPRDIRKLRQNPMIAAKKIIGRGHFSRVFDNGETVLKATVDSLYVDFVHWAQEQNNPCFPRLIAHHGVIGSCDFLECGDQNYIYLLELERLSHARALGKMLNNLSRIRMNTIDQIYKDRETGNPSMKEAFLDYPEMKIAAWRYLPDDAQAPKPLIEALRLLPNFLDEKEESVNIGDDLHFYNIMLRRSDGLPVITDPFTDRSLMGC